MARTCVLAAFCLAAATWDVRCRRVPNALVVAGLAAALVLSALQGPLALGSSLYGAAAFGGPLLLFWSLGFVGAGDAKCGFALGALLSMPQALDGLLWGAAAGGCLALACAAAALLRSAGDLRAAWRTGGTPALGARLAAHPAWRIGIPYAAALAAGSLCARL